MVSKCWLRQAAVLWSLLLVAPAWALSSVTATVDKNPVMAGEPFLLEIVADGRLSAQAFSSHPLLALGYVVGSTTTSSQTSIINGESTQTTRWRTNLLRSF